MVINNQANIFDINFLVPFQGVDSHSLFTEFIAVSNGIKPVMRTYAILPEKYSSLKNICLKNDLYTEHSNFKLLDDTTISKKGSGKFIYIYISKDKKLAEETKKTEEKIVMGIKNDYEEQLKLSQLMGYPKCCFDFLYEKMKHLQESHLIEFEAFKNTKSNFSYLLNNLIRGNKYLISHYPCSYDCKDSINYTNSVLKALRNLNSKMADDFVRLLKFPVMKFEKANYVRFINGKVDGNTVYYSNCDGSQNLCQIFQKGKQIVIEKDFIKILKNNEQVEKYKKISENDGTIFNFK